MVSQPLGPLNKLLGSLHLARLQIKTEVNPCAS